jgi:hypothetical protein
MRAIILLPILACALSGQPFARYDFSLSGGMGWDVGSSYPSSGSTVSLGATGGYRVTRWFELEAGAFGGLNPLGPECYSYGCQTPDSHYIWVPFGGRVIVPFAHDRFEWSVGAGGLYERFAASNLSAGLPYSYNGFGGYVKSSVAVALDRHRHFWIGMTPRMILANGGGARDRWILLTGDIGFRF